MPQNYAIIPGTVINGQVATSAGDGTGRVVWAAGSAGLRALSIDWAWSGTTVLPSGATGQIPEKRVPVLAGQIVTVYGVQYWGHVGGDVFELYYNGSALGSPKQWTTVTTTWTVDTSESFFPFVCADGDRLQPVFTTAAGDGWAVGVIYTTT